MHTKETVMEHLKRAAVAVLFAAGMLGILPGSGHVAGQAPAAPAVLGVLAAEMQRNFEVLSNEPTPAYFIGYTVHDESVAQIIATFGALQRSDESRGRFASVDVRVGDYTRDNTHPVRGEGGGGRGGRIPLPLTDEPDPIRLALWRATDRSFKAATETLTRIQTTVASNVRDEDPPPDFSREDPQVYTSEPVSYSLDTRAWETRLRRASALFAEDPLIFDGALSLTVRATNRYYVNTEGTRLATGDVQYRLFVQAYTKADDGMELPLYNSYFSRSADGLPDDATLARDVRSMMDMLARLRRAPLVDPYSGPAILSGQAAGVFFHEIFGHRVEGHRLRSADDAQTFAARLKEEVLPSFLSVVFDPTAEERADVELMGSYQFDDEGVRAQRVTVVDHGLLTGFLLGRTPLREFPRSNGHGRGEPGAVPVSRQSNLMVEASQTTTSEGLEEALREEARRQGKPFGLYFDNIQGGFTTTGRSNPNAFNVMPHVVYRIYTDGRPRELVRGVDLIGTPLAAFGKLMAASDRIEVFNGVCGAESGSVPVSASSPELLVREVEVQKKAQSLETAPLLPAPPPGPAGEGIF